LRALFWFCSNFNLGNITPSSRTKKVDEFELPINETDVIVPWVTVESISDGSSKVFDQFLTDLTSFSNHHKSKKIILVPFAHLSEKIAKRDVAFKVLLNLEKFLLENGFQVTRAHFGSYKDLSFESKANKLQVVSRVYPIPDFKK
jgi:threonyl-tRNA synthetase